MKRNTKYRYPTTKRETIEGQRHYDINNGQWKLPSVTTILDKTQSAEKREGLKYWREREGEKEASMTKESARDGTQVTWAIGRIQQDERIEVLYTIQGDPEAEYKVTDAQDFHGATFGEEVDEEPNIPEWLDREKPEILPPPSKESLGDIIDDIDKDEEPDTTELDNLTEEEEFEEQQDEGDAEEVPDSATDTKSCPACGAGVGIGSSLCSVCGFTFSL